MTTVGDAYHAWAMTFVALAQARELADAQPTAEHLAALRVARDARAQARDVALRLSPRQTSGGGVPAGEANDALRARKRAQRAERRALLAEQGTERSATVGERATGGGG